LNRATCCANSENTCYHWGGTDGDGCVDRTSADDWLFGLGPGLPAKFGTTGHPGYNDYQWIYAPTPSWPQWGNNGNDLRMGGHGALGVSGQCLQGRTYAGTDNQICGGNSWGVTHLETWVEDSTTLTTRPN
jgi:hypothetical protein